MLEEHSASADGDVPGAFRRWETEAILLSAPDRAGLAERARELIAWVEHHPQETLKDIAYTLNGCDEHPSVGVRLGLVVSSLADMVERLKAVLDRLGDPASRTVGDGRGVYHWDEPLAGNGTGAGGLAFLFPGEGSQYPGMLADLCIHFPEVRRQFDIADRIALDLGDTVPPSEHLFARSAGEVEGDEIWSAATGVNVVLNAQWALYQVLRRLGLRPDAVVGHSSGEMLALAAAGVIHVDRELEEQLGRLGAIFRGFETAGEMPPAQLVAVAAGRDRVESVIRELGASEVSVAIDNCPHQVVVAGPPAEVERVVLRLREQNILLEVLPFARPYHTASFGAVLGPIADSFARLSFRSPGLPIYSCATRGRMPAEPEAVRELAVAQWTRTVAFRETIEAMHADGLRIFVDVGARGNLAGFVQDTLRGRPAFAMAANVPRRSGLTQLNHLVAALFAQGVPVQPGFLYARRKPCRIDWSAQEAPGRTTVELKLGFPEMRLSDALVSRLREQRTKDLVGPAVPAENGADTRAGKLAQIEFPLDRIPAGIAGPTNGIDDAVLAFQETMRHFLQAQQEVLAAYMGHETSSNGHSLDAVPNGAWPHRDGFIPDTWESPPIETIFSGPEPGPWVGEVRRLAAGSEIEAVCFIDIDGDPIAENHTLGGRRVSALDPSVKGLPVLPFAVMAEMTAEAAALVVSPGLVLTALRQVRAHKWVRYEAEPVCLELRGHRVESDDDEERVWVGIFNRGIDGRAEASRPVFEAVAVFDTAPPAPPSASPWVLEDARPSRFTAESIYDEQWLFHGPALQAVVEVGLISRHGIDGLLRVRPWEPLLRPGQSPGLHTDAIAIDNFTHLLGCWGLDELADNGDVVFPLGMEALELFGERPEVGTDVDCRISILQIERHRIRVEAEIIRPDGTVWMRIRNWEDWRFHWPGRYRDVFRQPRDIFVGEELPLEDPARGPVPAVKAVWLAPPADMGRPVWRDVLEQIQLGPAERAAHLAIGGSERRRSHRLWGRIAAKEAARRIWQAEGRPSMYPADLVVVTEESGRPRLTCVDRFDDEPMPVISIAHADGVAVAIAAANPDAMVGIDVESITDRPDGFETTAFTPGERSLLERWRGRDRSEWITRFWCAKEAAAKATGIGLAGGPSGAEVIRVDENTGIVDLRLSPQLAAADFVRMENPLRVVTARRAEYAWAWTLQEGANP